MELYKTTNLLAGQKKGATLSQHVPNTYVSLDDYVIFIVVTPENPRVRL